MLRKPGLVLIDVDGTLVDSVPDLGYCVNVMMRELNMAQYDEIKIREWVGNGVERLVCRALTGQLDGEPESGLFDRAYPLFTACYAENVCKHSRLYPGVREGLDKLRGHELAVGCVTNKATRFTTPLLKYLGIYDDFAIVICGDTLERKKPDPAPLFYAAEQTGVRPENCLMVGDSVNDVSAARAAGFQVACVPYGYNHGNDIRDASPDAVIDTLAELDTLLTAGTV